MSRALIIAAVILGLNGCASTADDTTTGGAAGTKAEQKCEIVKSTGGRLGRKVCTPVG